MKNRSAISEFATGAAAGAAFLPWYHSIGLVPSAVVIAMCASLWALGGTLKKVYRRVGVPGLVCMAAARVAWPLSPIEIGSIVAAFAVIYAASSFGYGTPSMQPPDEGSALGKFWFKVFSGRMLYVELATRATVGCLVGSAAPALWLAFQDVPRWIPAATPLACAAAFAFIWYEMDGPGK